MKTLAAILVETGKPLVLAELEIPALKPGQALVQIDRSGVCHTQVLECRGRRGEDRFLPHCLGHEAGGTVLDIAAGVTKVKPGDAVILSWIKGSGANVPGTTYRWGGRSVNAGAVTTFSRLAVVSENRLTLKPEGLSMTEAALLGCAVPTGAGSVLNAAQPRPGQSLVVFGVGGVGGCAVGAAAACGCRPVIAVDVVEAKLELARTLGASAVVNASREDPIAAIQKLCPGGADFAIEATGRPVVMAQALQVVRPQGGTAVIIGNAPAGQMLTLDPQQFNQGKRLLGTWGGDSVPDRDTPRFAEWIAAGKLRLGELAARTYALTAINQALDDLEAARVARPIIDMALEGVMLVGFDFDNTIVSYDAIFRTAALERGLIPEALPTSKGKVRDYLRQQDREDAWTELQGYVYGARMLEAQPYPGVMACFAACRQARISVCIISHRTRHPFLGPRYDLHAAARNWIEANGFYGQSGLTPADVHFELTKEAKRDRVAARGCSVFVDDLPEFLGMNGFPAGMRKVLFDPDGNHADSKFERVRTWDAVAALLVAHLRGSAR